MSLISLYHKCLAKLHGIGYKTDQKGIIRRYYREKENWDIHLNNCKDFIIDQAEQFNDGKIAILGSGWLLDVPINDLLIKFDEVWLFDIYHPEIIRQQYKNNDKIHFVKCDLTNGIGELAKSSNSYNEFTGKLHEHKHYEFSEKFDLVLSLNLLNQLDILLCDYLKRRFLVSEEQLIGVRQIIQQQHITLLASNNSCLITDCAELSIDDAGSVVKEKDLIYCGFTQERLLKSWEWIFDTNKTYHQKFNTTFKVNAYSF